MTTLTEVKDFLKLFDLFESYGIGRIEESKKNVLGVYNLERNTRHKCIGNAEMYEMKPISLLVHGSTSKDATEKLAYNLYQAIDSLRDGTIAGKKIYIADLQQDAPIDVGVSDSKIYEYVIEVIFYIGK